MQAAPRPRSFRGFPLREDNFRERTRRTWGTALGASKDSGGMSLQPHAFT